jgi:Subtilase family
MADNKHVFLLNEKADNPKFKRQRGWKNKEEEEPAIPPQPKFIKDFQKERFRADNISFYAQQKLRRETRQITFPKYIDLVRIYFHAIFNADLINKFEERYGLSPVYFSHYNKTVVFEIIDENLFLNFEKHIEQVIESPDETSYDNQPFNLIALVLKFEFIGTNYRLLTSREKGILLTLISSSNIVFTEQKETLFKFLEAEKIPYTYNPAAPDIIEVNRINKARTKFVADNFDIIRMITSTRALKVRPGEYGAVRREYGFTIDSADHLTLVGIIDTGINKIEPLNDIITSANYDHTGKGSFWDEAGHGTMVAGLVALGDDFQKEIKESYAAKAKLIIIKALHFTDDDINIPQLLNDIRDARRKHGVRLFNMSLNIPSPKLYNDTYCQFAYELDKLAYEEDILIFISVGNFDKDSLHDLVITDTHPDHDYPTFFYNLNGTSQVHRCQNTNISEPSESLNNISIGALAGNMEDGDNTDVTPNNLSPAYYTRKFHFDYTQPVNKQPLRRNQNNKHLNKPDLVFDGGDLFKYEAGIEILRSPMADGEKYYGRSCGTSLSTPLVTSYAAEILNIYPSLKTQTVKALLINSATYFKKNTLPEFRTTTEAVLKSLVGFGKPQKDSLLSTDNNSIVLVIEGEIEIGQILTIPIILPAYLKDTGNKLKFDISLCYSFLPVKDNHLNYLPLHMSFNLVKNTDIKIIAEKDQVDYGIKPGFSWSEDHHGIENRIFANTQSKSYTLQSADMYALGDSIALGVRCLAKEEIPTTHSAYLKGQKHNFSVVLKVTELPESKASNQLYSEMIVCNIILNIGEAAGDATIELEN